jgi:signal transduction histidine kinase
MYKAKEESVFHKHLQLLKIVQEESDGIVSNIEYLGKYVKSKYSKEKHHLLTGLVQVQKNISTILILDKNGILIDFSSNIKNNKLFKGYDYSNTKHFLKVKNTNLSYWSDVYLSNSSLKPEISYSLKINKNYIAVLIIDLGILNNFAKKFKSDDGTTMVQIMDKDGIFLANPDNPYYISQRKSVKNSNLYKEHISKDHMFQQIKFNDVDINNNIGVYGITKKLNWYIVVKESYDFLFKSFNYLLLVIGFFIFLLILLSIYFSIKLFRSILKPLDTVILNMNNMAHDKYCENIEKTDYIEVDNLLKNFIFMQEKVKSREKKIFAEIEKNRQKDIQIFEQSKMASMGEMIANMAHQWRQPLSVISTAATGIQMQKKYDMLSDDKLDGICEMINTQTQYLSKTIDDFRNFIKGERILVIYDLKECMESFIELISPSAKNHNLNLILSFEENIKLNGYPNELKQCLINIFNNAKDVLLNLDDEDKLLFISTSKKKDNISIDIKDSGGGIPSDIFLKIFDPYFTTKHKSKGTGLGLHMAYNIIVDGMKGSITAKNIKFIYNDKEYKGVNFNISLPINI